MDKSGLLARLVPSADRGLVFGTLAFGTDTCNIITFTYTYYILRDYPRERKMSATAFGTMGLVFGRVCTVFDE